MFFFFFFFGFSEIIFKSEIEIMGVNDSSIFLGHGLCPRMIKDPYIC